MTHCFFEKKHIRKNLSGRVLTIALCGALLLPVALPVFTGSAVVEETAAARVLRLSAAKSIAAAKSEKVEAIELQIEAKEAARQSAIRSLKEKERSMSTFRWSPLLNFKFPTEPNEAEAFEFAYKPTQLQYEIDTLKHKITAIKLDEYEKVSTLYIDLITAVSEAEFLDQRIKALETAILKNKARLAEGTATQAQIDQQEKKLSGYKSSLASQQTKIQRAEEKLGKEVGFDLTTGYMFEDAFIATNIARDNVEYLQAYAVERDQTVFEAKQNMELAKLALTTNYNLMKSQYGNNIGMIEGFISQALEGTKIDKRSFKSAYDAFLKKIDEPWQGTKRILFFKFPKEWWKGDIDGIRYVEDDPYVLYSAALEYESARKEYENACSELEDSVSEGYDNLMETRRGYKTAILDHESMRNQLLYDEVLTALGQMTLEEYDTALGEYENSRSALRDALSLYSTTLFEFDRTTCGGASAFFSEEYITSKAGYAGLASTAEADGSLNDMLSLMSPIIKKGATYSIRDIVSDEEFMLYIDIPADFEYNVTHFELWSDGRQIGERVAVGESIRHLRLTIEDVDSVFVRLYDNDNFIDDCSIDPSESFGPLNLTTGYEMPGEDSVRPVGSFTVEDETGSDMIKLRFTFDQKGILENFGIDEPVFYYNISTERNLYLFSNDFISADDPFSYMSFIKNDIGQLNIRMFTEDGEYIGGAYFEPLTGKLMADTEITLADMQEMVARQLVVERKTKSLQVELDKLKDLLNAAQQVNSGEADSATITYYKNRIAELELEIANLADTVTNDEIQKALRDDEAEINRRVEELKAEEEKIDEEDGKLPDEDEINARSQILKDYAVQYIKTAKKEELKGAVRETIIEKGRKIAELQKQYKDLNADPTKNKAELEAIKKQIEDLNAEIDAANKKLEIIDADEKTVTDEEIEAALLEHGDEIYAMAQERLSDAMLYGSEVGQWSIAYLEANGFEVNEENMRLVASQAGNIDKHEKNLIRQEVLSKEIEEARKKSEVIRAQGGVANNSLANQLDQLVAAYEKELKQLSKDIKKSDPGKEVKLREYRAELEELTNRVSANNTKIAGLICSKYATLEDYIKPEKTKLGACDARIYAAQAKIDALIKEYSEKYKNNVPKADMEYYLGGLTIEELEGQLSVYESEARKLDEEFNKLRSKNSSLGPALSLYRSSPGLCRFFYSSATYDAVEKYDRRAESIANKMNSLLADIDAIKQIENGSRKTGFSDERMGEIKQSLEAETKEYQDEIAGMESEKAEINETIKTKTDQYNESLQIKAGLDAENAEMTSRIREINAIISDYY
ncbi:MAG: hypothetical protein IJ796_03490 [Lachnospiraceae bacterium]|nr:hypothetical protein [Lachnospiraceae bacterium]